MDSETLVLMGDVNPVPLSGGFVFWDGGDGRVTLFIEPAPGKQAGFELIEHRLDVGLSGIPGTSQRSLQRSDCRLRLLAADAHVFRKRGVPAGRTCNVTGAGDA